MSVAIAESPLNVELGPLEEQEVRRNNLEQLLEQTYNQLVTEVDGNADEEVLSKLRTNGARLLLGYIGLRVENPKSFSENIETASSDGPGGTVFGVDILSINSHSAFRFVVNEDKTVDFGAFAPNLATRTRDGNVAYAVTFGQGTIKSMERERYVGDPALTKDTRTLDFPRNRH